MASKSTAAQLPRMARDGHRIQPQYTMVELSQVLLKDQCQIGKCQAPFEYYWHRSGFKLKLCHECYVMLGGKRPRFMND